MKRLFFLFLILATVSIFLHGKTAQQTRFSRCYSLIIPSKNENTSEIAKLSFVRERSGNGIVWSETSSQPFSELILSWNAVRPRRGKFLFFVNIKYSASPSRRHALRSFSEVGSGWRKLAEWSANGQRTFCDTRNRYVHTKHVRAEMQKKRLAHSFQIKVLALGGADIRDLKALFANTSNWHEFRTQKSSQSLSSTFIPSVPKRSQWWLKHPRAKDLCSPTSISMMANYFALKHNFALPFQDFNHTAAEFADRAHDQSIDIYGNWLFNVAQAYNTTQGEVLYRVERLNNFDDLHAHLKRKIPVAVSIRGYLRGCAWAYKNGHFVVVIGWDQKNQRVICIDPAFRESKKLLRAYRIRDFLTAWGKSRNLAYVAIPKKRLL